MDLPQLDYSLISDIFKIIEPPVNNFPPSNQYFFNKLNSHFAYEAQIFLVQQKQLYLCAKKVQQKLRLILQSSINLSQKLLNKDQNCNRIYDQLNKYHQNKQKLQNRQKTLAMICELVRLQNLKQKFFIQKKINSSYNFEIKQNQRITQKIQLQINEEDYLQNIVKIYQIVKQSHLIFCEQDRKKYPLINQIIKQLAILFQNATTKALTQFLTPSMVQLILKKYTHPFLDKNFKVKQLFQTSFTNNRFQYYRLALNPIVNNLNYANNVSDLYENIIDIWIRIIEQDIQLFSVSGNQGIVSSATQLLSQQIMPKLQKNVYKIKQIAEISFVRFKINTIYQKLKNTKWQKQSLIQNQQIIYKWQEYLALLQKLKAIIISKLQEQCQLLSSQKYNIYSIGSYVPIREHLQSIKLCRTYCLSHQIPQIDWQLPFQRLCQTRQPQRQANNKSLVIFNLNIWYLYLKIIKGGRHQTRAVEVMLWCKQKFVEMNIQQTIKVYFQSLQKILDMCANISSFKNILYAQLHLLGHQVLRNQISLSIRQKYIAIYEQTLIKLQKQPMNNEQVQIFCQQHKINLNKFGKFSNQICIYSPEQLDNLLIYY